jgi:hypothetical protein
MTWATHADPSPPCYFLAPSNLKLQQHPTTPLSLLLTGRFHASWGSQYLQVGRAQPRVHKSNPGLEQQLGQGGCIQLPKGPLGLAGVLSLPSTCFQ